MAVLQRVRVALTGFPGAPGVMTFATTDVNAFISPLYAWLTAMSDYMPLDVTLKIENTGDEFDSTTGVIASTWTVVNQPAIQGKSPSSYAAPVGFLAHWITTVHLSGRLLRGRTFIVPGTNALYSGDGTIDAGVLAAIQAACATFVTNTAGSFAVWQRPRVAAAATPTRLAVTARAGGHGIVSSSRVPDKAVVLTSRRD